MARVKLKDGCPGCSRLWRDPGAEGQCSRCKRCLYCCGREFVAYSCARKSASRSATDPASDGRSARAYERWAANPAILGHNRRIT